MTPQGTFTVNTFAKYGVYAQTCGFNPNGSIFCNTYYSNAALNQASEPTHQHFALFQNPQNPYRPTSSAFEDGLGINPTEGYGDYNDVIFKLQTTQNQTFNHGRDEFRPRPCPRTGDLLDPGTGIGGTRIAAPFAPGPIAARVAS